MDGQRDVRLSLIASTPARRRDALDEDSQRRREHMIDLVDMTTFVSVIRAGSFTDAAAVLGVSKSMVSRRVSDLEEKLGACLLDRSSRSVKPTEIGEVYFANCVRIIESVNVANALANGFRHQMRGKIHAVFPESISGDALSRGIVEFVNSNPGIILSLTVTTSGQSGVERYRGREFDLLFHVGVVPDGNYIAHRVGSVEFGLYAGADYAAMHGGMEMLSELCRRTCSLESLSDRAIVDVVNPEASGIDGGANSRLRSDSVRQLLSAVEQGAGVLLAPRPLARDIVDGGRGVEILPDLFRHEKDVWALYPTHHRANGKVAAMIDMVHRALDGCR